MSVRKVVRKQLRRLGYDLIRFSSGSHPVARKRELLRHYRIDTVLDVGANTGQYGRHLREEMLFDGRIVSFEPMAAAFGALRLAAQTDARWDVVNYGVGEREEERELFLSANSASSSVLPMLPTHVNAAPEATYVGSETIKIRPLDSFLSEYHKEGERILLKVDTQGFEDSVFRGATEWMRHIDTLEVELSLVPLYEGQVLFEGLYGMLSGQGYSLVGVEPGFGDAKSGELLQLNGLFHRHGA